MASTLTRNTAGGSAEGSAAPNSRHASIGVDAVLLVLGLDPRDGLCKRRRQRGRNREQCLQHGGIQSSGRIPQSDGHAMPVQVISPAIEVSVGPRHRCWGW